MHICPSVLRIDSRKDEVDAQAVSELKVLQSTKEATVALLTDRAHDL